MIPESSNRKDSSEKHVMERFLELHRKIRSKLCKEIFGHTMAVIVFSALVIITLVDVLKYKDSDNTMKLVSIICGICHFDICATAILHLKYCGVLELNPVKCKIWIYLEIYNIAATTAFIVLATRHVLPPPFHQWTGTALLLIIYWLPLIMYKTSQVCRILELVSILNYLQDVPLNAAIRRSRQYVGDDNILGGLTGSVRSPPVLSPASASENKATSLNCGNTGLTNSPNIRVPSILPITKPLSVSTPQIPYEWALIDSFNGFIP